MTDKNKIRQFIFQRRGIRKYTGQPVSRDDIEILLEAGMAAPSANNYQPWFFVVITDRGILDQLAESHPYGKMLFDATLAIAVVGDTQKSPRYWIQDCSAATENILLAAAGLGLGAVWLGVHPRPERQGPLQKILRVPADYVLLSLLAVGHPAEEKAPRTQNDPSKVRWNTWHGEVPQKEHMEDRRS